MKINLRKLAQTVTIFGMLIAIVGLTLFLEQQHLFSNRWILLIGEVIGGLLTLYVLFTAVVIFLENRNPNKTVAWLLVLFLLPVVGFVMYIVFGQNFRKKQIFKKKKPVQPRIEQTVEFQKRILEYIDLFAGGNTQANKRLINLLLNNSDSPFYINNEVQVLSNGQETYPAMAEAIRGAFHHIHLETFILRDDDTGQMLKELLIEKAKEGVQIRILYDSVGSWTLGDAYIRSLKNAGIEIRPFFPVTFPLIRRELNYRNHRKILVVDGQVGFVGGLNIGDEYLGKNPKLGFWRDTHLKIEGDSVYRLQSIFCADWEYTTHENLGGNDYFPKMGKYNNCVVQIAASGPDSDWESILQGYFTLIATAEKRIWIATPYLVPEDSLMMALKTAALSGVDVRILIPGKADHFLVYWASRDNIEDLLEAGVRIFTYENGFIHSKILMVDGIGASIGTANLDIRSLEINFEVNAFVYDSVVVEKLEADFLEDLEKSKEIDLEEHRKRGFSKRFLESLGRIVSPLQ